MEEPKVLEGTAALVAWLEYWKCFFEKDGMTYFQEIKKVNPAYAAECLQMLIRCLADAADHLKQEKTDFEDRDPDFATKNH